MTDVVIVGSANLDLVVPVDRHPGPGETLLAGDLSRHPGGKGANQAVAAARAGGAVSAFVGCLGDDEAGHVLRESLDAAGVDCSQVLPHDGASGVALIWVTPDGGNTILVAPGSNGHVRITDAHAQLIHDARVVLAQLEIPIETVIDAARACGKDTTFILNAAPSRPLPDDLVALVDVLVVNEHEAADLCPGIEDLEQLAMTLQQRVPTVVVTLGADGVLLAQGGHVRHVPAFSVDAVDTTGAGDTFCGAFCAALARGVSVDEALTFGAAAGALAATRAGAQESVPTFADVLAFVQNAR